MTTLPAVDWTRPEGDDSSAGPPPPWVGKDGTPVGWMRRVLSHVQRGSDEECWPWTGAKTKGGYGVVRMGGRIGGKTQRAHRVVYELLWGPIPAGLHLDHVCHHRDPTCDRGVLCPHRACANPRHLEPVTQRENNHRSPSDNFRRYRERLAAEKCS